MIKISMAVASLWFLISGMCSAHAADPCLECHEKKTLGIVNYWKESIHSKKNISCTDCHGKDAEANHRGDVKVESSKCGSCHKEAFASHSISKHAIGLKAGRGCTRNMEKTDEQEKSCTFCHKPGSTVPVVNTECAMFVAQSPEMRRQGCDSCHMVETRCDTCHTKHGTDLSLAKRPETCGVCHMGPDHPQYEAWDTSPHGVIYRQGGEKAAPACVTCHMDKGTHNVSKGIATGIQEAGNMRRQERDFMLNICARCHTSSLAKGSLDDADNIEKQSSALVNEAKGVIEGLQKENLLMPDPSERPPHPLFGHKFVIGPHMLYENLSRVESLFFKMKQFYYMIAFKSVFHQNPDYAHWYGNAPLKLTLSEIKSEAALLRQMDIIKKRLDNLGAASAFEKDETGELKRKLSELNEKRLRGEISEKEYMELKNKLLNEKGL